VLLEEGDVASRIVHTAEETACSLIVMGTHGRSRLYQAILGSVAADVTRYASCPVVTVRASSAHPAVAGRQEREEKGSTCSSGASPFRAEEAGVRHSR
jgi:hypothetical protein